MKFNITIKSLTAGILSFFTAMIFFACKDDNIDGEPEISIPAKTYYLTLSIRTPNGGTTRAGDEDEGNEGEWSGPETNTDGSSSQGKVDAAINESKIDNVEIFICHEDDLLAYFRSPERAQIMSPSEAGYTGTTADYVLRAEINEEQIKDFAKHIDQGLDLYVIANKSSENKFYNFTSTNSKINKEAKYPLSGIGTFPIEDFGDDKIGKVLPLVNAKECKFKIDGINENADIEEKVQALLKKFNPINGVNILNMGSLELERGVARIEYKDIFRNPVNTQAAEITDNADLPVNTFKINNLGVNIRLMSLQVFNVNKGSYFFRHGSNGSISKAYDRPTIFGIERGTGNGYIWIATSDWEAATENWSETNSFTKVSVFYNTLDLTSTFLVTDDEDRTKQSTKGIIDIETLLKRETSEENGYHPWCYITENTLPSTSLFKDYEEETTTPGEGENGVTGEATTQEPVVTKYATGVAFKFLVLGKDGSPLQYETPLKTQEESLYPKEIENSNESEEDIKKEAILITDHNGKWVKVFPEQYKEGEVEKTGYFLTYIAPIVHNNQKGYDPSTGNFPPMFYGVVRNNTYQMSINSINGLPRPNDPRSLFISLDIKVLAWTVRETEYEF